MKSVEEENAEEAIEGDFEYVSVIFPGAEI